MAHRDSTLESQVPAEPKGRYSHTALALNPTAAWSHPSHRERTKRVHMSARKQPERPAGCGRSAHRTTHAQRHPSVPTPVSGREPPPAGCPSPPASPGRRVTFQVRSSSPPGGRSVSASSPTPPLCGPGRAQLSSAPAHRALGAVSGLLEPPLALRGSRGRGGRAAGGSCGDVGAAAFTALRGPPREGGAPEGGGSSAERRDGGGRGSAWGGVGEPGARFLEGGVTRAGANLYSGAGLRRQRQSALYTPNLRSEAT